MGVDYRKPIGLEGKFQYHIQCQSGDIAPVVIVPGDQGRVEKIVDQLSDVKKIADNRGLITFTGKYQDFPVSVTSTGMGGPSASIVYEELINIGAKVLIRIGSVAGLQENVDEGDIVIPYGCVRDDGASNYYIPPNYPAVPSPEVYSLLIESVKASEKNTIQALIGHIPVFTTEIPSIFRVGAEEEWFLWKWKPLLYLSYLLCGTLKLVLLAFATPIVISRQSIKKRIYLLVTPIDNILNNQ